MLASGGDDAGAALIVVVICGLYLWLLVWVFIDAQARSLSGIAWLLVVLLFSLLGLVSIFSSDRPAS